MSNVPKSPAAANENPAPAADQPKAGDAPRRDAQDAERNTPHTAREPRRAAENARARKNDSNRGVRAQGNDATPKHAASDESRRASERGAGRREPRQPREPHAPRAPRAPRVVEPNPIPPITYPEALPVSGRREEIAKAIARNQVVIVCGETGSGKTTQLPKICLELGRGLGAGGSGLDRKSVV